MLASSVVAQEWMGHYLKAFVATIVLQLASELLSFLSYPFDFQRQVPDTNSRKFSCTNMRKAIGLISWSSFKMEFCSD